MRYRNTENSLITRKKTTPTGINLLFIQTLPCINSLLLLLLMLFYIRISVSISKEVWYIMKNVAVKNNPCLSTLTIKDKHSFSNKQTPYPFSINSNVARVIKIIIS